MIKYSILSNLCYLRFKYYLMIINNIHLILIYYFNKVILMINI